MGNWSFKMEDDFTTPDGLENEGKFKYDVTDEKTNWKNIYDDFALKWLVHDKETPELGKSLFHHENAKSSNSYHRRDFQPEFQNYPEIPQNV